MESSLPIDAPIQPRPADFPVPLTATQLQIWEGLVKQGTRMSNMRMAAISARVLGALNVSLLYQSIQAVAQRHESLRTRIVCIDGAPKQHIESDYKFRLETVDLTALPATSIEAEVKRLVQEFVYEKVDVSIGPLFEGRLFRLSNQEHVLVLGLDHIVSDAISCEILSREVWKLYDQIVRGAPLSLPHLPVQFADYAVWQQRTSHAWHQEHAAYWIKHLAGAPHTKIPRGESVNYGNPTVATMHFPFGKSLTTSLSDLAVRERTKLPTLVFSIYTAFISRWLNQHDLITVFVTHGRHTLPVLENMVGFLATLMHLRISIDRNDTFLDLLRKASLEIHSAYGHFDFGRLPNFIPAILTELGFNWLTMNGLRSPSGQQGDTDCRLKVRPFPVTAAWPVTFYPYFSASASGINITVAYRTDLFAKRTIEQFGSNLRRFATICAHNPTVPLASLSVSM